MEQRFRVRNLTVSLGRDIDVDRVLCLLGTRACFGGTVWCLYPTEGCCGPVWSYPGGGVQITRAPETITFPECVRVISDRCLRTDGCGLNYSTCWGGSRFDFRDVTDFVKVVEVLHDDLAKATAELEEVLPEIQQAAMPQTVEEIDAAEAEIKAALEHLQDLRKRMGKKG